MLVCAYVSARVVAVCFVVRVALCVCSALCMWRCCVAVVCVVLYCAVGVCFAWLVKKIACASCLFPHLRLRSHLLTIVIALW